MSMLLGLGQGLQQAAGTVGDMYRQKESNRRYGLEQDLAERERRDRNNQMGLNQMNADAASMRAEQGLEIDRQQLAIQQDDSRRRQIEQFRGELMGGFQPGNELPESALTKMTELGMTDVWSSPAQNDGMMGPQQQGQIMKDLRTPQELQAQADKDRNFELEQQRVDAYGRMADAQFLNGGNKQDRLLDEQQRQRLLAFIGGQREKIEKRMADLAYLRSSPAQKEVDQQRLQELDLQEESLTQSLMRDLLPPADNANLRQNMEAVQKALGGGEGRAGRVQATPPPSGKPF